MSPSSSEESSGILDAFSALAATLQQKKTQGDRPPTQQTAPQSSPSDACSSSSGGSALEKLDRLASSASWAAIATSSGRSSPLTIQEIDRGVLLLRKLTQPKLTSPDASSSSSSSESRPSPNPASSSNGSVYSPRVNHPLKSLQTRPLTPSRGLIQSDSEGSQVPEPGIHSPYGEPGCPLKR